MTETWTQKRPVDVNVDVVERSDDGRRLVRWDCPKCNGAGEYPDHHENRVVCNLCEGTGELEQVFKRKTGAAPKGTYNLE